MITEQGIKSALKSAPTSGKASIEIKDDGERGVGRLTLLIRVKGERLISEWYTVWYRDGRRKMAKIGAYPTVSLGDARKKFRETYAPAISKGEEPVRPNTRKEARLPTVGELFTAYADDLDRQGVRSAIKARRVLLGADGTGGAAKVIGRNKVAAAVEPSDIVSVLKPIHERGAITQANATRTYISAAFNWAMKAEFSFFTSVSGVKWGLKSNPTAAVPMNPDAMRVGTRHLTPAQFRAFWAWLEGRDSRNVAARSLRLQMASGQRVEEILHLSKDAYARDDAMLDWSRTKNGLPHAIPLPKQAVAILDGLVANEHGLYFPKKGAPAMPATLTAARDLTESFCEETETEHFTPRDLRRTWKTLSGAAGIAKEIRDRIQNHARSDVSSKHYDRYDYLAEKRAAMKVWEAYLDRILSGDLDAGVVPLKERGAA